jgi:DNA-binding response OmpR family regulator
VPQEGKLMRATVLVVEDDDALRDLLSFHLGQAGFAVRAAPTLEQAHALLAGTDLLVLDWMLPDGTGVDWLRRMRQQPERAKLPVLMLTARASEVDKVTGFGAGADDYLVKPFSTAELVARLGALLRRTGVQTRHEVGPLVVDEAQGVASLAGERLRLTRREFDLLAFLASHPGRVFSRGDLLDRVWGEDFLGTDRTVDQHVAQLRAIVGAELIETVRGRGYRLVDPRHDAR